jgi:colicin import membrane protein
MKVQTAQEDKNETRGMITSAAVHALILLLFILPIWKLNTEPPVEAPILIEMGGGGDDAALGQPDAGKNDAPADAGQQMDDPSQTETVEDPAPTPPKPAEAPKPTPVPKSEPAKSTATTEDPNVAAVKRAKEQAEKDRQNQIQEQNRQKQEAEKKQRAEADRIAQEKAAEEKRKQDEYNKKKGKYGSGLGSGGSGQGSGSGGKAGNQGIENGSPDGKNPLGTSPGSGGGTGGGVGTGNGPAVGGGLSGRKVRSPKITDTSQETGTIMIDVCADSDGNVTSASFARKGSTTQDSDLVKKALAAAKASKFDKSSADSQCGTLAYTFKLQ